MNSTGRSIELVLFEGCPNAPKARENLRAALERAGPESDWTEWNLEARELPDRLTRYGSPTVLIDGEDVTGKEKAEVAVDEGGLACRADGAPSVDQILRALRKE